MKFIAFLWKNDVVSVVQWKNDVVSVVQELK